jgi:hypothetical protein
VLGRPLCLRIGPVNQRPGTASLPGPSSGPRFRGRFAAHFWARFRARFRARFPAPSTAGLVGLSSARLVAAAAPLVGLGRCRVAALTCGPVPAVRFTANSRPSRSGIGLGRRGLLYSRWPAEPSRAAARRRGRRSPGAHGCSQQRRLVGRREPGGDRNGPRPLVDGPTQKIFGLAATSAGGRGSGYTNYSMSTRHTSSLFCPRFSWNVTGCPFQGMRVALWGREKLISGAPYIRLFGPGRGPADLPFSSIPDALSLVKPGFYTSLDALYSESLSSSLPASHTQSRPVTGDST